jgi:hypothetical protein
VSRTQPSLALFTDQYELTMAQAYWQSGVTAPATFSLFIRKYPPNRGYFVSAGLADVLDYLQSFRFTSEDIEYLHSLERFHEGFLDHLSTLRFTGSVRALPEGTVFFANEPVIEVTAPVIEAQLVETFILNQINLQTILATKETGTAPAPSRPGSDGARGLGQGQYRTPLYRNWLTATHISLHDAVLLVKHSYLRNADCQVFLSSRQSAVILNCLWHEHCQQGRGWS